MSINKDSQKVPNLRFKGFTDDWEHRKLGDIADFSKGQGFSKKDLTKKGTPIILYGSMYTNFKTVIENINTFTSNGEGAVISEGGELIIPSSGESPREIARATVVLMKGIILGGDLNILKFAHENNSIFIAFSLSSEKYKNKLAKFAQGKSIVHLYNSDIKDLGIYIANPEEQSEISKLLLLVENTITLHQRKLDQLNQLKEALLQQMFPGKGEMVPKLRFAGFEGDWEERKLGNLLHERNQKSVQTEEYPLVSFTVENGVTEKTERYNRNQLVSGDSDAKVYKVTKLNDIVYNPANLKFGAIDRNKYGKAVFSPIYVTFEVIEDYIFAEFIEFIVTSQTFIGRALKYQQGTVYERQSVGVDDFLNLTIRIPNLDEQKLIGLFLNDLNKELLLQKDKLDQLKNMKQVLLQNMFI